MWLVSGGEIVTKREIGFGGGVRFVLGGRIESEGPAISYHRKGLRADGYRCCLSIFRRLSTYEGLLRRVHIPNELRAQC